MLRAVGEKGGNEKKGKPTSLCGDTTLRMICLTWSANQLNFLWASLLSSPLLVLSSLAYRRYGGCKGVLLLSLHYLSVSITYFPMTNSSQPIFPRTTGRKRILCHHIALRTQEGINNSSVIPLTILPITLTRKCSMSLWHISIRNSEGTLEYKVARPSFHLCFVDLKGIAIHWTLELCSPRHVNRLQITLRSTHKNISGGQLRIRMPISLPPFRRERGDLILNSELVLCSCCAKGFSTGSKRYSTSVGRMYYITNGWIPIQLSRCTYHRNALTTQVVNWPLSTRPVLLHYQSFFCIMAYMFSLMPPSC